MSHHPPNPPPDPPEPRLSDADMRVLDFLAEHGFDASRVHLLPEADRPRAMALVRQMQVLDHYPAEGADDALVDATLARIDRWEAANAEAHRLPSRRMGAFRIPDFVGIAALVVVGVGVLVPVVSRVRAQGLVTACGDNLRSVHGALGQYASQHDGLLPATASIADVGSLFSSWGRPGRAAAPAPVPAERRIATGAAMQPPQPMQQMQVEFRTPTSVTRIRFSIPDWSRQNHSDHLAHLARTGFCGPAELTCPACASGGPCFAYRVPVRGERFALDGPGRCVVVADANPLVEAHRRRWPIDSRIRSSLNHGETGQNMLFDDGAVEWRTTPLLELPAGGAPDNIWVPRDSLGRERVDLGAWPTVPTDNFVAQ
jgi:hypothetical protein